jgi:hypothetical protein
VKQSAALADFEVYDVRGSTQGEIHRVVGGARVLLRFYHRVDRSASSSGIPPIFALNAKMLFLMQSHAREVMLNGTSNRHRYSALSLSGEGGDGGYTVPWYRSAQEALDRFGP